MSAAHVIAAAIEGHERSISTEDSCVCGWKLPDEHGLPSSAQHEAWVLHRGVGILAALLDADYVVVPR